MSTILEVRVRLGVCILALIASILYTVGALEFRDLAMYAPLTAGLAISVCLAVAVLRDIIRLVRLSAGEKIEISRSFETSSDIGEVALSPGVLRAASRYVLLVSVFVLAIWLVGLYVAAPVFLIYLARFDAKWSLRRAFLAGACFVVFMFAMQTFIAIRWPLGLLFG